MTLLVGSVFAESLEQVAEASAGAFSGGADAVELRIDGYEGEPAALAAFLRSQANRTWIVTCRSAEEGGHFRGDTMERVSRLLGVVRGTNAYVDFEFSDWERSANIRQKVLLAATGETGPRLILSYHDFEKRPADTEQRVSRMLEVPQAAAAKVAYRGRTAADSFAALDLMHRHDGRVIAIDMGESGTWTRILAKKLGAFATFASLEGSAATAPGQVTLRDMHGRYRWEPIGSASRVFAVVGDPVAHSRSPLLFNRWFAQMEIDAVYVPHRVEVGPTQLKSFIEECQARLWLDLGGFSVTIPHKEAAFHLLVDSADPLARRIGAVNTIAFHEGQLRGFNTDCYAASASLAHRLGQTPIDLVGTTVDVLGAGGSARAVVEGLMDFGCRVTVYARLRDRAVSLVAGRGIEVKAWEQRVQRSGEVLINCTPLGMWPRLDESPMPASALAGARLVFDLIYNPLESRLLREAREAGCETLNGLDMFVRQAAMQLELWFGRTPDFEAEKAWAEDELRNRCAESQQLSPPNPRPERVKASRCIVLIGMRGAGKTTVGRELARRLGTTFLDTDAEIERLSGRTIAAIFSQEGEAGFRQREAELIRKVAEHPPGVLSLGGGAILDDANIAVLRPLARFVWLQATADALWGRTAQDPKSLSGRPPLSTSSGQTEIAELLSSREPRYLRVSDISIDTSRRTVAEVADEILAKL